jgi:hypothetical protein
MKKLLIFVVIAVLAYGYIQDQDFSLPGPSSATESDVALQDAYTNRQSDIQVKAVGTVTKTLSDDLDGSRHQRFIIRLSSGQTLLVSHNIDLAPRIDSLSPGDTVEFFGEYEWNDKGGVIHWTHLDPNGRHVAGWIKHQGKTYQ